MAMAADVSGAFLLCSLAIMWHMQQHALAAPAIKTRHKMTVLLASTSKDE
jgi:hypothetical protein